MEACPFCGGEVNEQLVIYGGTCPHCFGSIPGEEAATDPGEDVKAALEAQDRKRASRRTLIPVLGAGGLALLVAAGAAFLFFQPEKELPVLDLDAGEYYTPDLDALVLAQAETQNKKVADEADSGTAVGSEGVKTEDRRVAAAGTSTERKAAPTIKTPKIGSGNDEKDLELLAGLGGADAEDVTRKVRSGGDIKATGLGGDLELSAGLSSGGSVSGGGMALDMGEIKQSGAPLSGGQIVTHVRDVLRRQLPKLRTCYESSLRANPSLRGSWVLTFKVETDGSVTGAAANGADMADPVFEECLTRRVASWRFKRLVKPQPVKKTVPFRKG